MLRQEVERPGPPGVGEFVDEAGVGQQDEQDDEREMLGAHGEREAQFAATVGAGGAEMARSFFW